VVVAVEKQFHFASRRKRDQPDKGLRSNAPKAQIYAAGSSRPPPALPNRLVFRRHPFKAGGPIKGEVIEIGSSGKIAFQTASASQPTPALDWEGRAVLRMQRRRSSDRVAFEVFHPTMNNLGVSWQNAIFPGQDVIWCEHQHNSRRFGYFPLLSHQLGRLLQTYKYLRTEHAVLIGSGFQCWY
jgi:hypothetical protein